MTNPEDLPRLRMCVAEATIDVNRARDNERLVKAVTEQQIIEAAGGEKNLGANAEARERALTIALNNTSIYIQAISRLRAAETTVLRVTSQLEIARDRRRERELSVRIALVQALGHDVQTDDGQLDSDYFDAAAEDVAESLIEDYATA